MLDPRSSDGWAACPFLGRMSISTRLVWLTINGHRLLLTTLDCSHKDYKTVLQSCSVLMEEHTELHFNKLIRWDIDALSTDFAIWLAADNVHPAAISRVGILSSIECQRLLHHYLDEDLCTNLRLLVKTSSLLYNRRDSPHPYYGREQLNLIRSSVGAKMLKSLEAALKSTTLAEASKEKLKGVFLVLLGVIIAITYTITTDSEEARYELLRILAHHMIFVGERIGLLDCDLTKQRLTESCHKIWNKTGNFEWNYEISSAVEGMDMGASLEQGQNCLGLSPAASVSIESPRAFVPEENYHQPGNIPNIASASDALHQVDPIHSARPQSAAGLWPNYGWLGSFGTEHSSSPIAMGMTICFLCNGSFPSDEMCPACFGPLPVTAGYSDVALQGKFGLTSPVPDSRAFGSMTMNTEAIPIYRGTELWQSDTLASSSLRRPESSSGSPQISRYSFRSRTPTEKDVPPDVEDKSGRSNARSGGTKRKLPDQSKKTRVIVQEPPKHTEKTPRQSRREPPLVRESSYCGLCGMIMDVSAADFGSTKKCHHLQCSQCEISYTEPGFWGRGSWTCCCCGDGPKPTPPLSRSCENIHYPYSSLPLCRMCSRTALV